MPNFSPLSSSLGPATVTTLGGSCRQEPVEVTSRSGNRIGLVGRTRMPVGAGVEVNLGGDVLLGDVLSVEPTENGHFALIRVKYAMASGALAEHEQEEAVRSSLVSLLGHLRAAETPAPQSAQNDRNRSR